MVWKSVTKKKTNEAIKQKLLNSLQENNDVQEQELNKIANSANNSQEDMPHLQFTATRTLLKFKIKKQ